MSCLKLSILSPFCIKGLSSSITFRTQLLFFFFSFFLRSSLPLKHINNLYAHEMLWVTCVGEVHLTCYYHLEAQELKCTGNCLLPLNIQKIEKLPSFLYNILVYLKKIIQDNSWNIYTLDISSMYNVLCFVFCHVFRARLPGILTCATLHWS